MDKNSIIGFVLIGVILFGFTFYQSGKQKEAYEAEKARLDSIAAIEALNPVQENVLEAELEMEEAPSKDRSVYVDSLIQASSDAEGSLITLENDKFEVVFNTKGAQPYSVRIKDYYNYDSTDLYLFKPGKNEYAIHIYNGQYLNTSKLNFNVAELTDTSVVMRLPFADGGYIEQKYSISEGSYGVRNLLSFVGMNSIPRNVSAIDIDYSTVVPRMEKGYKNESQYSKLDYYFEGDKKPVEMGRGGRSASKRIESKLSWFAFQQQFFSTIIKADNQFASGELTVNFCSEKDEERNLMTCTAKMRMDYKPGQDVTMPFDMYFGPNDYNILKSYDSKFEKIIPLGGWLVGWFTRFVIIPLFNFFHGFIANFGIIILLMTLVIKTVVFPLMYKSFASSAKMQALKPELDKIAEKYPKQEDAMKKQQATMDLYKRAGVSPMGGCLPTLLTFPILWAMFRFFPASIELRQQSFLWCHDLSAYDSIVDFGVRVPLLGDHLSLFAILMAVVMWGYSKMTMQGQPSANDPSAASMKFMSVWMMPIMMFFICNSVSAALSYYYLLSQLIAMIQTWAIRKTIDKDKILAKVRESEGKPVPKSKWQMRLEAAQKMQQQQMKEQQKKRR